MQNKPFRLGPVALTTTYTTNIMNPPTLTGGVGASETKTYILIRHIRVVNKTSSAATFRLFQGATGANTAGTEVVGIDKSVPANDSVDYYGQWYFRTADFLVGGAGTTLALVLTAEGEIGVAD
jgi:hypothetical protein